MNTEDLTGPIPIADADTGSDYDPGDEQAKRHARGWARALKVRRAELAEVTEIYDDEINALVAAKKDRLSGINNQIGYLEKAIIRAHQAVNLRKETDGEDPIGTWDLVHIKSKSRRVPAKDRFTLDISNVDDLADSLAQVGLDSLVKVTRKVGLTDLKKLLSDGGLEVVTLADTGTGEITGHFLKHKDGQLTGIEVTPRDVNRTYSV